MSALGTFTPVKATGFGALLSRLNPNNALLAVGGAADRRRRSATSNGPRAGPPIAPF